MLIGCGMQFQDGPKLLSVGALQYFRIEIRADPSTVPIPLSFCQGRFFFYPVVTTYLFFFLYLHTQINAAERKKTKCP